MSHGAELAELGPGLQPDLPGFSQLVGGAGCREQSRSTDIATQENHSVGTAPPSQQLCLPSMPSQGFFWCRGNWGPHQSPVLSLSFLQLQDILQEPLQPPALSFQPYLALSDFGELSQCRRCLGVLNQKCKVRKCS